MMALPRPDLPPGAPRRRTVPKLKKPKNPKIVWYGKNKPKLDPNKYDIKRRGGGLGYVAMRKPAAPAASAAAPPAPTGPYAEYADYPWAQQQLKQLDRDQAFQQTYVSDKVLPWASQALTNLTGVNPSQPGINPVMQQQYLANVQGNVGGALNAAAAAGQAPTLAATTPGGVMASPTQYLSQAASEGARGMASSYLQSAQIQSALNTMQPNLMSQSYIMQLGDFAKGLPAVYAQKRSELRSSIDEFIAKSQAEAAQQEETARHNRVSESISAMNAQTNAAIQFGNLGVSATRATNDAGNVTGADGPFPAGTPAPVGKQAVTGNDGMTYFVDENPTSTGSGGGGTTYAGGGTSTRDAKGRSRAAVLRDQGWSGAFAKKPKVNQAVFQLTQGADNKWYVKKRSGASRGTPTATQAKAAAGTKPFDFQKKLQSAYDGGLIDASDQNKGTGDLLRFLRDNQPTDKKNFNNWWKQVLPVLKRMEPKFAVWMAGYVARRQNRGEWKGSF